MKARTLVIGDIHGGLAALIQVLERAEASLHDTLIFLGDYVDGWSQSAELFDYLIKLAQKQSCIFMIGNHDLWHLEWLEKGTTNASWLANGGNATIASYRNYKEMDKLKHLYFLKKMKGCYINEYNQLFVHAGFTSVYGAQHEKYESNLSWDRTLWEMALCMDKTLSEDHPYFPRRLKLYHEIFIGHSATTKYHLTEPMNIGNLWNIDTGAGFSGKLTVMDAATKKFWQSDYVKDLYPKEPGRMH